MTLSRGEGRRIVNYSNASASERRFLPPAVAVSTVAFALNPPHDARLGEADPGSSASPASAVTPLWIPLVRRTRPPFAGCWALPGGPIPWDETLVDTALRTLRAAVLRDPSYLEQLYSFGAIERSADAQRLVTIAYWALYGERELSARPSRELQARETGELHPDANVAWFSADRLPDLAFDHAEIVGYALWRLRLKTEYQAVAHRFLGPAFTLAQCGACTRRSSARPWTLPISGGRCSPRAASSTRARCRPAEGTGPPGSTASATKRIHCPSR